MPGGIPPDFDHVAIEEVAVVQIWNIATRSHGLCLAGLHDSLARNRLLAEVLRGICDTWSSRIVVACGVVVSL